MTKPIREARWDNIKFFLIYLVILGHVMEYFCDQYAAVRGIFFFIYSFHMPAFLYISGLFGRRTIESDTYNSKKLLPYLLVCFFLNFYRAVSLWIYNPDHKFHFDDQNNISWFLMALFACYSIAWVLRKFDKRYVLVFSILIALIAGYDTHIDDTFTISRIVAFFPFFYAGYCTDRKKLETFLDKKSTKIASGSILTVYLILCLTLTRYFYAFRPLVTGRNSYAKFPLGMQPYTWIFRLIFYFGSMLLMLCFFSIVPKKNLGRISLYGQRTLAVYFWHLPFVTIACHIGGLERFANDHLWFILLFGILYAALLQFVFSLKAFSVPLDYAMRPDLWTKRREEKALQKKEPKS